MKTRLFSGWKTRAQMLCLAALCGLMTAGVASTAFAAQDTVAPTTEAPASDAAPAAVEAAAPAETVAAPAEALAEEAPAEEAPAPTISKPDTVWVLVSAVLVIFMTLPGLALFYGGLVRSKNVLSILIQNLAVFSLVAVLWAVYGYSFAFTEGNAFIGGTDRLFAAGLNASSIGATFTKGVYIPELAFFVFQGAFACITCALIVGAFAERVKFAGVMLFTVLWFTFAYLPMAHMVWFFPGPDAFTSNEVVPEVLAKSGYLWAKGALDFAGGTVVHINAAIAGLVGAYVIGKRTGYGREAIKPHNLTLTMVGASILWVGWFGFNAGSNLEVSSSLGLIALNTHLAAVAGALGALLAQRSTASPVLLTTTVNGSIGGLVGITAGCASMAPGFALLSGLVAGFVVVYGMRLLDRLQLDDVVGAIPVHGFAGIWGTLAAGLFYQGDLFNWERVAVQALGAAAAFLWAFPVALVFYFLLAKTMGLRVSTQHEQRGLDFAEHAEVGYPEFNLTQTFDSEQWSRRG